MKLKYMHFICLTKIDSIILTCPRHLYILNKTCLCISEFESCLTQPTKPACKMRDAPHLKRLFQVV